MSVEQNHTRSSAYVLPTPQLVGDVGIHPLRLRELLRWLEEALARGKPATIFYANVHAINLTRRDPALRAVYREAEVVFCDGQGLRLGAALLGRPLPERFTPPDWIDGLAAICASGSHRIFLLGGHPGVAEEAARRLEANHAGLQIATHDGYFLSTPDGEQAVLEAIRAFQPTLLLVGMGMPMQEYWIAAQRAQIAAPVVMTVGALFDYLAGTVTRGPRWLTDNGLEWLCRLWYEPRRLWQRYLIGNPRFALLIVQQMLAERHVAKDRHKRG